MRSITRLTLALSLTLALPGCIGFGGKTILAGAPPCTDLVPQQWIADAKAGGGVQHAPDPEPAAPKPTLGGPGDPQQIIYLRNLSDWTLVEQKKWASFGVAEAQKLEDANGRTRDAVAIVAQCEARDALAVKKAQPKVLGIF